MKPKPPSRTGYLLLEALATGRQHGYALSKKVESDTDGEVRLGAGSLYNNLDRLLAAGLIEEAGAEVVDGRNRRYYQLTGSGRAQLAEHVRQMQARVASISTALGLA